MNCYCPQCNGVGHVTCNECDGGGYVEFRIESAPLHEKMEHFGELSELKKDAMRVANEAKQLSDLKPERAGQYQEQLRATLAVINAQADRLTKK